MGTNVNFIPGSFQVTLGSDAPLGLVERIRLSAISNIYTWTLDCGFFFMDILD